ncbi:MAG: NADP-dependent malic enzyme [Bacteroidetes bacterium]|nr:NADP-dependent malic enzyme [Bacteroidota bacterium]
MIIRKKDALDYHSEGRPGKIEVVSTKPTLSQRDLSLAYTPGVAEPCREIHQDKDAVYKYTAKGNLVAVISNGTAVLGLGDIGPEAGKPVMEGKGVLFKKFADIDVFDIEINSKDPEEVITIVKSLEPTFGGINLEDIKAPDCFYIESRLREIMDIPVFHDDQHGTAIITGAAFLNALELAGKKAEKVKIVVSGAGAAANAVVKLFCKLGAEASNVYMFDSKGFVTTTRPEPIDKVKMEFAQSLPVMSLKECLNGADVFLGLSVGGLLKPDMITGMSENPIIFALANPDPEIGYKEATEARPDVIMATGRSDFPNQVNNVLGFPFIFRGALDVRAKTINEEMKLAAVYAIAGLAKEEVPESVKKIYGLNSLKFGRTYIIPKPFDPRVLVRVAPAVAKAAMETGVARLGIQNFEEYEQELITRMGWSKDIIRRVIHKAKLNPKRVVIAEGDHPVALKAAQILLDEKIAEPILLGNVAKINKLAAELDMDLQDILVIDPRTYPDLDRYATEFLKARERKGVSRIDVYDLIKHRSYFGPMMVRLGEADALVTGVTTSYSRYIKPAIQIIGQKPGSRRVSGLHLILTKNSALFFADTTLNINPDAETLAEIAIQSADFVKSLNIEPVIGMLSFSSFGSVRTPESAKVEKATALVKKARPDLDIEGELQADLALDFEAARDIFPFSGLKGNANVLIFPNLDAANIAVKLMGKIGQAEIVGPLFLGLNQPAHILPVYRDVNDLVNVAAIAVSQIGN